MRGTKGEIINFRYEILEKLGEGGFGRVFKCRQLEMNRNVVIKTIIHNPDVDNALKERFVLEATAVSKLKHPNIITYYDFGQDEDGDFFLVMEMLEGKNLYEIIKTESPLPLARIVHIILQVADALHESHINGITHRDVKPNNIFVIRQGQDPDFVKLIDFGILALKQIPSQLQQNTLEVKELSHLTKSGFILGTPEYMAPEMIANEFVDPRADQYALGLILYEMLTGYKPFEADSQIDFMIKHIKENPIEISKRPHGRNIPLALKRVVMKTIKKIPVDRYESMLLFRYHLLKAIQSITDSESLEKTETRDQIEPLTRHDQHPILKDNKIKKISIFKKTNPFFLFFTIFIVILAIFFVSYDKFLTINPDNQKTSSTSKSKHIQSAISFRNELLYDVSPRRGADLINLTSSVPQTETKYMDNSTGILSLNVSPWAHVKFNGKYIGKTPLNEIKVPAGKCILILEHPDFQSRKIVLTVKNGEHVKMFLDMRK